jgi:hypothetical protein
MIPIAFVLMLYDISVAAKHSLIFFISRKKNGIQLNRFPSN